MTDRYLLVATDEWTAFAVAYRNGDDPQVHQTVARGRDAEHVLSTMLKRDGVSVESILDLGMAFEALDEQFGETPRNALPL